MRFPWSAKYANHHWCFFPSTIPKVMVSARSPIEKLSIDCANTISPFFRDYGRCRNLLCFYWWCCPIILSRFTQKRPCLCGTFISLLLNFFLADPRYFPQLPHDFKRFEPEGLTWFWILCSVRIIALRLPWPLANANSTTLPANAQAPVSPTALGLVWLRLALKTISPACFLFVPPIFLLSLFLYFSLSLCLYFSFFLLFTFFSSLSVFIHSKHNQPKPLLVVPISLHPIPSPTKA